MFALVLATMAGVQAYWREVQAYLAAEQQSGGFRWPATTIKSV
jgi:hypothetical protein